MVVYTTTLLKIMNNNYLDRFFRHHIMIQLGILPIDDLYYDVNVALSKLSPSERRKVTRKFRKIWRKVVKDDPEFNFICAKESNSYRKYVVNNYVNQLIIKMKQQYLGKVI